MVGHESQAIENHSQTLERLAERGGLHPIEMACVLENRRYIKKVNGLWQELNLPFSLWVIKKHTKEHERQLNDL